MIRRGAALIIVLLILVALTLLGLPFLFSQTWGLAGARSMQAHQSAQIYLGTAERLGIALGIYANDGAARATTGTDTSVQMHSALELYLADNMPTPVLDLITSQPLSPLDPATTRNHAVVEPKAFGLNHGPTAAIAVSIADESGMLDPNLLDAEGWADLFKKLDIPDWDDDDVEISWQKDEGPDQDRIGELAQDLAWYRVNTGRFARLDDLRIPTPQLSWRHTLNGTRSPHPEFRKRLNAAEAERLRPYLSFHNRGVGRRGLTDLGSIVASDKDFIADGTIDQATAPGKWFVPNRFSVDLGEAILNHGTWVEGEPKTGDPLQVGLVRMRGDEKVGYNYEVTFPGGTVPERDAGLWLQVPPALNVHQLGDILRELPAYRWANKIPQSPATTTELPDPGTFPIRAYSQITAPALKPDLPWLYLRPRFTPFTDDPTKPELIGPPRERQPLDLRSDGLVRIEASASILDAAGGQAAQRSRTTIVQAVPQEGPIERRWITQGQFEPLVGQRFTSQMTTWPKATGRATDVEPDDVLPAAATAPSDLTGLSFTTLAGPANYSAGTSGPLKHLNLTWRTPLGSRNPGTSVDPTAADYVLKDRRVIGTTAATENPTGENPVEELPDLKAPTLTQGTSTGLYPDGVRIGPDTQFAYAFNRDGGPLRMTDPGTAPASPPDSSLGFCHLGFWFKPETDWITATEPITLMEACAHPTQAAKYTGLGEVAIGNTQFGSPTNQNYFGVLYDPRQNALVACYTPPSASAVADFPLFKVDADNLATAGIDERCLPGLNWLTPKRLDAVLCANWSQAFQPNRIFTMWKLGRRRDSTGIVPNVPEIGRWYHLQVMIGNGRPGGIAIILDGITGTDVGLMKAKDYLASRQASPLKGPWPGDHLTFPSLLLTSPLTPVPKPLMNPSDLYVSEIEVDMPGFAAFDGDDYSSTPGVGLTPQMSNPSQGSVLIGDEYIRYQGIRPQGSGTNARFFLQNCIRGDRQNSFTYAPDNPPVNNAFLLRTPTTEAHEAGSRVIADGFRLTPDGTDDLYRGGTTTEEPFRFRNTDGRIIGDLSVSGVITPLPATLPITNASDFADRGYGRLQIDGVWDDYVYFTRFGTSVTIEMGENSSSDAPDLGIQPKLEAKIPDGSTTIPRPQDDSVYVAPNIPLAQLRGTISLVVPAGKVARLVQVSLRITDDPKLLNPEFFQRPSGLVDDNLSALGGGESSPHERPLFQIMHPTDGRCEWIRYTDIVRRETGEAYLIDRNGWNDDSIRPQVRSRGQERTPTYTGDFPIGSVVLPVQTGMQPSTIKSNLNNYCKLMSPGDLVTFVPKDFSSSQKPIIARVRYASNDGYDTSKSENNDTVNGFFTLTARLPDDFNRSSQNWEIVMGSGLNTPRDLTPLGPVALRPSSLPRLDAHAFNSQSGRLVLGAADPTRPVKTPPTTPPPSRISVDGFYAGDARNSDARLVRAYSDVGPVAAILPNLDLPLFVEADRAIFQLNNSESDHLFLCEIGGETFACERLLDADVNTVVTAIKAIPTARRRLPGKDEPTPEDWVNSNRGRFAKLVGRSLLGSGAPNKYVTGGIGHPFSFSPNLSQFGDSQQERFGNLDRGPDILRLPIGPVRYLTEPDKLSTGKWFQVDDVVRSGTGASSSTIRKASNTLANNVLMITEPNRPGAKYPWEGALEMMQIADRDGRQFLTAWDPNTLSSVNVIPGNKENPNFNRMVTSRWLRGLYNTPAETDWTQSQFITGGRDVLQPLVIGWWPRYASCLPSLKPSDSDPLGILTPQHLRSRLFPWIGMAMRLHGGRFEDTADEAAFALRLRAASNGCLDTQSGMRLEIRAMAGTINGREDVAGAFAGTSGIRGDWWSIAPQLPSIVNGWQYVRGLYPWNPSGGPATALETDGVEIRMHFRYTGVTTTDLSEIARNGGRAPLIGGAKMRCYAPVSIIATDEAR